MSENLEKAPAESKNDQELDDLLDSALEDMAPSTVRRKSSAGGSSINGAEDGVEWNPSENVWSEEFLQNAAATFESNMASLLSSLKGVPEDSISQDQIAATFQMMAEAAAQVMKPPGTTETPPVEDLNTPRPFNDVSAAIAQTLESLNANSDNLQSSINEEDLNNMFKGLNLAKEGDGGNMFVPFMQGMMQSLLSKEVLYPSLKDIVDKYPKWLEEHKDTLNNDDFERYTKQNVLMTKVCAELEQEQETDSEDTKKKRFDKVLELMQQMQELGQPPSELGGDMPNIAPPPDMGMADPSQCRPM